MAGGDGSQAVVAAVAADHGLPFVCIPAGTRNHLAADLGIDRAHPASALDAFGSARETTIDLAEANGEVFVNNVSLGLYARIVASEQYREAKRRTVAEMLPELLGPRRRTFRDRCRRPERGDRRRAARPGVEQPLRAGERDRVRFAAPGWTQACSESQLSVSAVCPMSTGSWLWKLRAIPSATRAGATGPPPSLRSEGRPCLRSLPTARRIPGGPRSASWYDRGRSGFESLPGSGALHQPFSKPP